MSRVRFPSPAPVLRPFLPGRFCCWFCNLCSPFVEVLNNSPSCCGSIHIAPNNPGNVLLFPGHDLRDDTFWKSRDVEPRCRCSPQIVKMQVSADKPSADLCL